MRIIDTWYHCPRCKLNYLIDEIDVLDENCPECGMHLEQHYEDDQDYADNKADEKFHDLKTTG